MILVLVCQNINSPCCDVPNTSICLLINFFMPHPTFLGESAVKNWFRFIGQVTVTQLSKIRQSHKFNYWVPCCLTVSLTSHPGVCLPQEEIRALDVVSFFRTERRSLISCWLYLPTQACEWVLYQEMMPLCTALSCSYNHFLCPSSSPGCCRWPGARPQPRLCPWQLLSCNRGPAGWTREEPEGLIHMRHEEKRALLHCQSSAGQCVCECVWTHLWY